MKLSSVKQGAEGTIALTQSHGEQVDWEKVGSFYARPLVEMKEFFQEGEGVCTQTRVSILIAPMPSASAPSTSVPSLSTPAPMDLASAEVA
jgi:hypothetical protein